MKATYGSVKPEHLAEYCKSIKVDQYYYPNIGLVINIFYPIDFDHGHHDNRSAIFIVKPKEDAA